MAQVRFLDQVPIGVFPNENGGTISVYQDGLLISSSVSALNFTGSFSLASFQTNSVTIELITTPGFPFSGSAVITGSLLISGSDAVYSFVNIGSSVFSGSVQSTLGFTGSLQGTSSLALTASYIDGGTF